MNMLPVTAAYKLKEQPQENRWLIEGLWAEQAVGIVGGEPKCCKSFLALTLAVAVASGKDCLEQFPVRRKGRVLIFPAEDALPVVKRRLQGIAASQELSLDSLPIFVITAPVLRLDTLTDRQRLRKTLETVKPVLLILDPFVRLHAIDENAAGDVAKILNGLRQLQRSLGVAIALVHHAKKSTGKARAGQTLRGSSEFHAWGDSNLYLRRSASAALSLVIEHRAEHAPEPLAITLDVAKQPHLRIVQTVTPAKAPLAACSPQEQILRVLFDAHRPLRSTEIRNLLRLRHSTVSEALHVLTKSGAIITANGGFTLPPPAHS